MKFVEWSMQGTEFVNCNCGYGCPCQFHGDPTHGDCCAYGFTQIDLGCFPPVGAALLPTIAGRAATELILLGTRLTAQRAKDLGIVTDVAPPNGLSDRVEALVGRLLEKSGAALRASAVALRATPEALARQVEVLQRMRRHYVSDVLVTEDSREGIDAHLEGRPPRWKHR